MNYKIKAFSIYEFGKRTDADGNPHQEDCLFPEYSKQTDADRTFILCDGMGGHDAGEVASATVCEAMSQAVLDNGHDKDGVFTDDDFAIALASAFDALDKKDTGASKKMGTTMTFLKLHNDGATIAHIGDSRVYHIRPGKGGEDTKILFETEDHSLVHDLIKIGELSREEARTSGQKNIITRAMQPNMERRPKADIYHTADIKPGDYFYMCSDGMLEQDDMESGESLKNIFSEEGGDDDRKVEILRGATDENRDNHSAFIIHVLDVHNPVVNSDAEKNSAASSIKHEAIVEESEDAHVQAQDKGENTHDRAKDNGENAAHVCQSNKHRTLRKWLILCAALIAISAVAAFVVTCLKRKTTGPSEGKKVNIEVINRSHRLQI